MVRKSSLLLVLVVVVALALFQASPARAAISNMRLENAGCRGVTILVDYDGVTGGSGANKVRFTATRVDTSAQLGQTALDVGATAATGLTATLGWPELDPTVQVRVNVDQIDAVNAVLSSISQTYTCGQGAAPAGTAGPSPTPTTTVTPTPISDFEREAQQGIVRLYDDHYTAVVYRMANGDIQFYHLPPPGVFIGNVPAGQMNPTLYQPAQLIGQFTAFDGWRVDLYFHGWNVWLAAFHNGSGARVADAWFEYGDPAAGQPAREGQGTGQQPQAGVPGGIPQVQGLPFVPQPVLPPPANLAPFVVVFPTATPVPYLLNQQIVVVPYGNLAVIARVSLNVRAGPSQSAARLFVIPAGTTVTLAARDYTGLWAYGFLADGRAGWMATRYLTANLAQILALPVAQ